MPLQYIISWSCKFCRGLVNASSNDILSFYSCMVATLECILVAMYNVLVIILYIRYFCYFVF